MTNLTATIQHHSISSARVVDLKTTDLTLAKRRASAEFRGEFNDYTICIMAEPEPCNSSGIVSSRRVSDRKWKDRM